YDVSPWNVNSAGPTGTPGTHSFRNFLEGFIGPGMHNAAHMWVGGSMMPGTSPNDPVFFLHHANVDRIWSNWQRKFFKTQDYLPILGGNQGHNWPDPMSPGGGTSPPQSVLDPFSRGYWYDDAPTPAVSAIAPASGVGAGGTSVVVTGLGFMGATSVSFGGNAATAFTVDSDTQITCSSPAGSGTVDIVVTTPVGTSSALPADQFTYAAPMPVVTGISPTSGPATGGTSVTITGTGFTGVPSVGFGGTGVNVQSGATDTQLVVVSPGGTGTVDLTVTTPAGTSATSPSDQFTYV